MQRRIAMSACVAAVTAVLALGAAAQDNLNRGPALLSSYTPSVDLGPGASDDDGMAILLAVERKFGGVMRGMYGWDSASFERFYGYKNLPVSVLKQALAAASYEEMLGTFNNYYVALHQAAMTKAYSVKSYPMGTTLPGEEADPLVVAAKQSASKVLGDTAKDLVFIPIAPCTVWDTRFATNVASAGTITNGATKSFFAYSTVSPGNFTAYGGNASCAEATSGFAGGTPVAVMMTVYANNATANGWVTFYKYADPDPSQATISVYYSPGPTHTQNVIAKVNGGAYDVSATSRFASVDASASVVGYFMQSPATPLNCTAVEGTAATAAVSTDSFALFPACATGYTRTGGYCHGPGNNTNGYLIETGASGCVYRNLSSTTTYSFTPVASCCRVPGR
jgi:hypothetical protein